MKNRTNLRSDCTSETFELVFSAAPNFFSTIRFADHSARFFPSPSSLYSIPKAKDQKLGARDDESTKAQQRCGTNSRSDKIGRAKGLRAKKGDCRECFWSLVKN